MSDKEAGIGIVSLIAGALIGGFGYKAFFAADATIDKSGAGPGSSTKTGAPTDLSTENDKLRSQIATLQSELKRQKLAAAEEEKAKQDEVSKSIVEAAAKMGVQFDDPNFQAALASIDWNAVGMSMKDMVPLIQKLAEQLAKGEAPDLALAGEVQKLNGELLKAAQKIMEGKIPGSGINGSFTHPAVVANQFAAALKAAGMELTPEQRESMDRAMKFYVSKDESLRLADHESKIQTLAEEAEFKDAFYKEARGLLSEEQRAALTPKGHEGRLGLDIFDSTLMLGEFARPLPVKNAGELAASVSARISGVAKLDADARKQLDVVLKRWSSELPAEFWADKANKLDMRGNMSGNRLRTALKRQAALTKEILANVKMSPEARAELLKNSVFFVPLPR